MSEDAARRIMEAWVELETAMRNALPVCSVSPPNQPTELLAALRINHRIGEGEEQRIVALRELRNRAAYQPEAPSREVADQFEAEVARLKGHLGEAPGAAC